MSIGGPNGTEYRRAQEMLRAEATFGSFFTPPEQADQSAAIGEEANDVKRTLFDDSVLTDKEDDTAGSVAEWRIEHGW